MEMSMNRAPESMKGSVNNFSRSMCKFNPRGMHSSLAEYLKDIDARKQEVNPYIVDLDEKIAPTDKKHIIRSHFYMYG
jgi:hypothetical protein